MSLKKSDSNVIITNMFLTLSLYQCTYNNEIEADNINTGFGNLKVK